MKEPMIRYHAVLAITVGLVVALALAAAPWANAAIAAHFAAPADTATVLVGNGSISYAPITETVAVGDAVKWVWTGDGFGHSTTSGSCAGLACTPDGKWDSGLSAAAGFTFTQTFTQSGTYAYYCT